jgi:hypothetical protein
MEFKNWLFTEVESDVNVLYDACRWVTAVGTNLGYLVNSMHNAPQSVPENIHKNAPLASAALQACVKASDAIMGTHPGQGRGSLPWIEANRPTVETLLANIVAPLTKLLPLIPPDMGKIAENGQKLLGKIAAAGIGGSAGHDQPEVVPDAPRTQGPAATAGPEQISMRKLEIDFGLRPGTLDIQTLPRSGMVSVRNRKTGQTVSVKPDRKSIEDGIVQIM